MGLGIGIEITSRFSIDYELPQMKLTIDHRRIDRAGAGGMKITYTRELDLLCLQLLDAGQLKFISGQIKTEGFGPQVIRAGACELRAAGGLRKHQAGDLDLLLCQTQVYIQELEGFAVSCPIGEADLTVAIQVMRRSGNAGAQVQHAVDGIREAG